MNKLLHALLLLGLISCSKQKTDQAPLAPTSSATDTHASIVPIKIDLPTHFSANAVNELSKYINCIFQDNHDNYWFASNGEGVYCFDGKVLYQFTTKDGLPDNQVFTIQQDQQYNIWLLTIGGISRFNGKTFTTYPEKSETQFFSEKNLKIGPNDLWFEMSGGAYRYDGHLFSYLLLPPSELDPNRFNPTNPQVPDIRKLNAYSIYCSLKDKKGNLWFGTQTMGVCRYDGKTFKWFTEHGLAGPAVRALFEDSKGNVWFGNNGEGLFKYSGEDLIDFTEEQKLGNPAFLKTGKSGPNTMARVWSVNEDNDGYIWIGTYDAGLWRYNPKLSDGQGTNLTHYTTKDGLCSNAINTIFKDKKGELWFGTDGAGVCRYNRNQFSIFTVKSKTQ